MDKSSKAIAQQAQAIMPAVKHRVQCITAGTTAVGHDVSGNLLDDERQMNMRSQEKNYVRWFKFIYPKWEQYVNAKKQLLYPFLILIILTFLLLFLTRSYIPPFIRNKEILFIFEISKVLLLFSFLFIAFKLLLAQTAKRYGITCKKCGKPFFNDLDYLKEVFTGLLCNKCNKSTIIKLKYEIICRTPLFQKIVMAFFTPTIPLSLMLLIGFFSKDKFIPDYEELIPVKGKCQKIEANRPCINFCIDKSDLIFHYPNFYPGSAGLINELNSNNFLEVGIIKDDTTTSKNIWYVKKDLNTIISFDEIVSYSKFNERLKYLLMLVIFVGGLVLVWINLGIYLNLIEIVFKLSKR